MTWASLRVPMFVALLLSGPLASAQDPGDEEEGPIEVTPAKAEQGLEGLEVPDDVEPTEPSAPVVVYRPESGKERVVRVLSDLGDLRVVIMPTGELKAVPMSATQATDAKPTVISDAQMGAWLRESGLSGFTFRRAGYFFYAYQCTDDFYAHTRRILESMLKGVVKQLRDWGLEVRRPETPLVVIMLPSRTAFDAFRKMPPGVAAYYHIDSNCVVLYEDDRLFDAAPEYALKQASYIIAHEAIHQLLANTNIQKRRSGWPAWVTEGLAEYFCPLRVNSQIKRTGRDEIPERAVRWVSPGMVNDLRMRDLLRTPGQRGRVIETVVSAPGLTAHGYSVAWGLVHYLAEEEPKKFAAYLQDQSQSRPLTLPPAAKQHGPDPLFVKHFTDDFELIEIAVRKHLTSRKIQSAYTDPIDNQTHYVMSVTVKRGRTFYTSAGAATSPTRAREWVERERAKLDAEGLKGHIVTKKFRTRRAAAIYLGKMRARLQ